MAAMGRKIVVVGFGVNLSFLTDTAHDRPSAVRYECWWHEVVLAVEIYRAVLVDSFLDLISTVPIVSEPRSSSSGEGRSMKRRKDRSVSTRWSKRLLESIEWSARLRW